MKKPNYSELEKGYLLLQKYFETEEDKSDGKYLRRLQRWFIQTERTEKWYNERK